jgi:hypothetical protein
MHYEDHFSAKIEAKSQAIFDKLLFSYFLFYDLYDLLFIMWSRFAFVMLFYGVFYFNCRVILLLVVLENFNYLFLLKL